MNAYQKNTVAIQMPTALTVKDYLTVRANMDMKEMVFHVKVSVNYSPAMTIHTYDSMHHLLFLFL